MSTPRTIAFSGWGQPPTAPRSVIFDASPIDYMRYSSIEALFSSLPVMECDTLIGWSLGGQLAIRAVANGIIQPKRLLLISTPFHFSHPDADIFYQAVETQPELALKRFRLMIAEGDSNQKAVIRELGIATPPPPTLTYWLKELYNFNCNTIDYTSFPPTLIIHGEQDHIVPVAQAEELASQFPHSKLVIFSHAAHAPHLHDSKKICRMIGTFLRDSNNS